MITLAAILILLIPALAIAKYMDYCMELNSTKKPCPSGK